MNNQRMDGFTLLELMLVLGVIAVVAVGSFFGYKVVQERQKAVMQAQQFVQLVDGFSKAYVNSQGFEPNLSLNVAVNNGAIAPSLLTGQELRDVEGHPISIHSEIRNGVDGGAVVFGLNQLSTSRCTRLVHQVFKHFNEIQVNETVLKEHKKDNLDSKQVSQACQHSSKMSLVYYAPGLEGEAGGAGGDLGSGSSGSMPPPHHSGPDLLDPLVPGEVKDIDPIAFNPPAYVPNPIENLPSQPGTPPSGPVIGYPPTTPTTPPPVSTEPLPEPPGSYSVSNVQLCGSVRDAGGNELLYRCKVMPDLLSTDKIRVPSALIYCSDGRDGCNASDVAAMKNGTQVIFSLTAELKLYIKPDPTLGIQGGWASFHGVTAYCTVPFKSLTTKICYTPVESNGVRIYYGIGDGGFYSGYFTAEAFFVAAGAGGWPGNGDMDSTGGSRMYGWPSYVWRWSTGQSAPIDRGVCGAGNRSCFVNGVQVLSSRTVYATDPVP